jgi:hypothetical protein
MPGEDHDSDGGQGVDSRSSPSAGNPETRKPHQERGTEDRRLAADEEHVEPGGDRYGDQRRSAGQTEEAGDGEQAGRQQRDVETGDREDVDGAGDHERLGRLREEGLARAEEERCGKRAPLSRKMAS